MQNKMEGMLTYFAIWSSEVKTLILADSNSFPLSLSQTTVLLCHLTKTGSHFQHNRRAKAAVTAKEHFQRIARLLVGDKFSSSSFRI